MWDFELNALLLPLCKQLVSELLSECAHIRDVASREQHIAGKVRELFLKVSNRLTPSDRLIMETIDQLLSTHKHKLRRILLSSEVFKHLLRLFVVALQIVDLLTHSLQSRLLLLQNAIRFIELLLGLSKLGFLWLHNLHDISEVVHRNTPHADRLTSLGFLLNIFWHETLIRGVFLQLFVQTRRDLFFLVSLEDLNERIRIVHKLFGLWPTGLFV